MCDCSVAAPLAVLRGFAVRCQQGFQSLAPLLLPQLHALVASDVARDRARPALRAAVAACLYHTALDLQAQKLADIVVRCQATLSCGAVVGVPTDAVDDLKVTAEPCCGAKPSTLLFSPRGVTACAQIVMRAVCSTCLPSNPLPPFAFECLLPLVTRTVSASPSLPLLQPVLALINAHASLPSRTNDKMAALLRVSASGGVTSLSVTLSDSDSATVPLQWLTLGESVAEAARVAAFFACLVDDTVESEHPMLAMNLYLSHRQLRVALVDGLLEAATVAPKGHPSPSDVLAAVVRGIPKVTDTPTATSTFSIHEAGASLWCLCALCMCAVCMCALCMCTLWVCTLWVCTLWVCALWVGVLVDAVLCFLVCPRHLHRGDASAVLLSWCRRTVGRAWPAELVVGRAHGCTVLRRCHSQRARRHTRQRAAQGQRSCVVWWCCCRGGIWIWFWIWFWICHRCRRCCTGLRRRGGACQRSVARGSRCQRGDRQLRRRAVGADWPRAEVSAARSHCPLQRR